jgi:methylmalonyl-CoA/ethylmalonyl-CoA epimerase
MLKELHFHHIAYTVYDLERSAAPYVNAGFTKSENTYDPEQNVLLCFLRKEGMPTIELVAPYDDKSPINKILEKNRVAPYHLCYEVCNIEEAISELRKQRYMVVSKPVQAIALESRKVAFLYNKDVGLIELLEAK